MLIVAERYPEFGKHLGTKYIDHVLKSGNFKVAWKYVNSMDSLLFRLKLKIRILIKSSAYAVTSDRQDSVQKDGHAEN